MKIVAPLIVLTAMLLGLPLLGAVLAGKPVYLYLEFPPVTRYVQHAEFLLTRVLGARFVVAAPIGRIGSDVPAAGAGWASL